jgi:cytochrome c oxidase subunit 4
MHSPTHHIAPTGLYFTIFGALMLLTALTVGVTYIDLGEANLIVAMAIAVFKASLVVLYFMHVRWSPKLVQLTFVTSLLFFGILVAFTLGDYFSRGALGVLGR